MSEVARKIKIEKSENYISAYSDSCQISLNSKKENIDFYFFEESSGIPTEHVVMKDGSVTITKDQQYDSTRMLHAHIKMSISSVNSLRQILDELMAENDL